MIYKSDELENAALLDCAQAMAAAARTAPKAKGIDNTVTLVLTGEDKDKLADEMEKYDEAVNGPSRSFITRDANCVRKSGAVILIGFKKFYYGLNCGYCGKASCEEAKAANVCCCFGTIDLGIAVGSAVSTAQDMKVDSRVMFTIGKVAATLKYVDDDVLFLGIPLSVSGKSPFFDRK